MKKSNLLAFSALVCGCGFALNVGAQPLMDDADVGGTVASVNTKNSANDLKNNKLWRAEHNNAVRLARGGDTASALKILEELHSEHPGDLGVTRDYLVISGWAGHDDVVVRIFKELPGKQPDYVLQAVGQSYRNLRKPEDALVIYRLGLQQSPGNTVFQVGEIRSMADARHAEEALDVADKNLKTHGERVDILLAASYAAQADDKGVESLRYCFRAVHADSKNRLAQHDLIQAIDFIGAPQVARERADEQPGVLSQAEYRNLQGDEAAAAVRWDNMEKLNETDRFVAVDRAIAKLDALIAGWSKEGGVAEDNILRARFDRLIALHDRSRMKDVVAEYEDMARHHVKIPAYALTAVGNAYLYLQQPKKARDIYQQVLREDPNNFDARLQLVYAYVETDDYPAAYKQADSLAADRPIWLYLKFAGEFSMAIPNSERASADILTGYTRLYGEEFTEAEKRISAIANAAPGDSDYRAGLGTVYESQGWPRSAQEQYEIGTAMMQGHDVENETGQARVDLELQNYRDVAAETADLTQRFPENLDVQRVNRLWDVHNMPELDIEAENMFRSSTDAAGGNGFGVDTKLYSQPINYNWRVFADEFLAYEVEPTGEGSIHLSSSAAGIEYKGYGLTASAAPTFNHYNSDAIGTTGNDRVGGQLNASYAINDVWSLGTDDEIFSRDTPLRALNDGITADSVKMGATYRASDAREVAINAEFMSFSDQNRRTSLGLAYNERLYTNPSFKIDAVSDLGESNDSKDEERLYYNPKMDAMGLVGLQATQVLYRHYEIVYEQSLKYMPGPYWESSYGTSMAQVAEYDQTLHINDVLELKAGVSFARQDYDGVPENDVSLLGNLVYRF